MSRKPSKRVTVNEDSSDILSSMIRPGIREVRLNEDFDIFVRRVGERERESDKGGFQGKEQRARDEKTVKKRYRDSDEVHDLISKIDEAIGVMEGQEKNRRFSGAGKGTPLSSTQRKGIEDLVENGHKILDEMRDDQGGDSRRPDKAKEKELRNVLKNLKSRLVSSVPPGEKAYYENQDSRVLRQKVNESEDRISSLIDQLQENQKHLDSKKTPSKFE